MSGSGATEFTVRIEPGDEQARALLERLAERATIEPAGRGRGTTLVLGGARSGKSYWAEHQLEGLADVEYVATSYVDPDDAEWVERVALHRARRPASWRTTETIDLPAVLASADPAPVLIDCLAVWLDRVLFDAGAWDDIPGWRDAVEEKVAALVEAVARTDRDVLMVSNEVGLSIVPATAAGRMYRDLLGRLNARVASAAGEVWFCVAGIARRIK